MATLTLPNGTVLTKVTRASCLNRVAAIPLQSYEYSHDKAMIVKVAARDLDAHRAERGKLARASRQAAALRLLTELDEQDLAEVLAQLQKHTP